MMKADGKLDSGVNESGAVIQSRVMLLHASLEHRVQRANSGSKHSQRGNKPLNLKRNAR